LWFRWLSWPSYFIMTSRSLWYNIPHSIEWFHHFFPNNFVSRRCYILPNSVQKHDFFFLVLLSFPFFHSYWYSMIWPNSNQVCPYNKLFYGLSKLRTVLKYNIHNGITAGGTTWVTTHVVEHYELLHTTTPNICGLVLNLSLHLRGIGERPCRRQQWTFSGLCVVLAEYIHHAHVLNNLTGASKFKIVEWVIGI
jgi:hypothetical protein